MDTSPTDLRVRIAATREHLTSTARELREKIGGERAMVRRELYRNAYRVMGAGLGVGFLLGYFTARRR